METYRIGVVGCAGRMGRMNLATIHRADGCAIAGGSEAEGSEFIGADIGELIGIGPLGQAVESDPVELFARAEAIIDFTTPAASVRHAELAAQAKAVYVVGTTGLDTEQQGAIERAAVHTAVVQAANMSLGVNILQLLVERAARALDADYDIEVLEMHHRHKVDAPSGTALALGRAAASGRGIDLAGASDRVRDGITGPRQRGHIGFAALRGGDVTGEHSVVFAGEGERLVLGHVATSREIYARGALKAALWARGKPPGHYGMKDVLGLSG